MTEEGTQTDGWRAQLPDDLKEHELVMPHEKLGDFVKAQIDVAKTKSDLDGKLANSIQLLKDDASDEDRATFFTKLGRPEKPEGYEFKKPDLPEEIKYDEDQEKEFRKLAHKTGLSQAHAAVFYDWYHQNILKSYKILQNASKKDFDDAVGELKKDWGDKYDENTEVAKRAAHAVEEKLGIKGFIALMDSTGFGNNPLFVKAFHAIGTRIMDDKTLQGTPPGGNGLKTTPDGKSAAEEKVLSYPSMETK